MKHCNWLGLATSRPYDPMQSVSMGLTGTGGTRPIHLHEKQAKSKRKTEQMMTDYDEYEVTRFLDEYGYQFSPELNVRAVLIQGEWAESGMLIYGVKTGGQKLAQGLRNRGAT